MVGDVIDRVSYVYEKHPLFQLQQIMQTPGCALMPFMQWHPNKGTAHLNSTCYADLRLGLH